MTSGGESTDVPSTAAYPLTLDAPPWPPPMTRWEFGGSWGALTHSDFAFLISAKPGSLTLSDTGQTGRRGRITRAVRLRLRNGHRGQPATREER